MARKSLSPATLLFPTPVVLVTCVDEAGKPNIITLAWVGVVNSDPPMVSVSIQPKRYSHACVTRTREFVINLSILELSRPERQTSTSCVRCGGAGRNGPAGQASSTGRRRWKIQAMRMLRP